VTSSLMHWSLAAMTGMVAIRSATIAVAEEPQLRRKMFEASLPLSVMQAVGDISGVNVNIDSSYNNFYVIGLQLAVPGHNVNVKEWEYLDRNRSYYILTAVRDAGTALTQRTFILEQHLVPKLGLDSKQLKQLQRGRLGDIYPSQHSHILLAKRQFKFPSLGQYLRNDTNEFNYAIYPRVVDVVSQPADSRAVTNIRAALSKGDVNANYRIQPTFE
jgi:hypothetical protein